MIEKKISYDINIEKPSKTKPVTQGGVLNYLGKQKTVTAPRRWRSSPDHPIAHLAYITKDEEKILIDLNLYGSLKGKPNKGPSGIMSLQGSGGGAGGGDGGSSGGDGGQGDSGPGGSDDGSSQGVGSGEGESTGDANDQGGTEGPGGMGMGSEGSSLGDAPGTQGGTVGEAQAAAESVSADNVSMAAQAEAEDAATAAAAAAAEQSGLSKAMEAVKGYMTNPTNIGRAIGFSAFGIPGAIVGSMIGSNIGKGVTGPSDDTQEQSSVQTGPAQDSSGGGGITTIQQYAPVSNISTGDSTADAIRKRLEDLLKPSTSPVISLPNVNPLSNYTLQDLYSLRRK